MYILDWYDRYHCYQDANRDPKGIDRLKGRLYRVRYKDTPRAKDFDLVKESSDKLIDLMGSENVFIRETAQRVLVERMRKIEVENSVALNSVKNRLMGIAKSHKESKHKRLHSFWTLIGADLLQTYWTLKGNPDESFIKNIPNSPFDD